MEFIKKDYLERIGRLRMLDDDFMSKVFEDPKCAEILLRIILNRKDLTVQHVQVQHCIHNLQGRSVRLDIYAVDTNGKLYDVEVQRDDRGAGRKRARYNSSVIDADIAEAGKQFENLPETYVIFITENDVLKGNLPLYHIDRIIRETGEFFMDEEHIIYVNAQITDETELGRLMHDFWCTNPSDMKNNILAQRVRYFKEEQEGVMVMCKEFEKLYAEGKAEGRAEGRADAICKMIKKDYTNTMIQDIFDDVTDEEIENIRKEIFVVS